MKKIVLSILMMFVLSTSLVYFVSADTSDADIQSLMDSIDKIIEEETTATTGSTTTTIFSDMPSDTTYASAITKLYKAGFVKGSNGKVFPDQSLNRYQFGLLVYRILNSNPDYVKSMKAGSSISFTDKYTDDAEFVTAIAYLSKYGIMKGYTKDGKNYLAPFSNLKGQEVLAVLGRVIYGLKDSTTGNWYQTYVDKFVEKGIIAKNWSYIDKDIPRKEVFRIIVATLGL